MIDPWTWAWDALRVLALGAMRYGPAAWPVLLLVVWGLASGAVLAAVGPAIVAGWVRRRIRRRRAGGGGA